MSGGTVNAHAFARLRAEARARAALAELRRNGGTLMGMPEDRAMGIVEALILARGAGVDLSQLRETEV